MFLTEFSLGRLFLDNTAIWNESFVTNMYGEDRAFRTRLYIPSKQRYDSIRVSSYQRVEI